MMHTVVAGNHFTRIGFPENSCQQTLESRIGGVSSQHGVPQIVLLLGRGSLGVLDGKGVHKNNLK